MILHGRPRSLILAPKDFPILVLNGIVGDPILQRFGDIRASVRKATFSMPTPIPAKISGVIPLE